MFPWTKTNEQTEGKIMLDSVLKALKGDLGKVSEVLVSVQSLLAYFEADEKIDPSAKDAAIDALIQLLQSKKSTTPAS